MSEFGVLDTVDAGELHGIIERLFQAKGASHNFKLGVLAAAHALAAEEEQELRFQLLMGMIHIQASVVTLATTEVSHLSQGLKSVLDVSEEDIKRAGEEVDKLYKDMKGSEPQE